VLSTLLLQSIHLPFFLNTIILLMEGCLGNGIKVGLLSRTVCRSPVSQFMLELNSACRHPWRGWAAKVPRNGLVCFRSAKLPQFAAELYYVFVLSICFIAQMEGENILTSHDRTLCVLGAVVVRLVRGPTKTVFAITNRLKYLGLGLLPWNTWRSRRPVLPTRLILWAGLIVVFPSIHPATAAETAISNVQAVALSPGTVVFTWQTSLPSTSQVVFVDSSYAVINATPPDPILVTRHQVLVPVRPSTSYTYYVASYVGPGQGVGASSANSSAPTHISTPAADPNAQPDYRLEIYGAQVVYQGHDLYVGIISTLLAGPKAHIYFDPPSGLPPGVTVHVICKYNADILNEQADSYWDSSGRQWCYTGNDASFIARIRTSSATLPSTYNIGLHTEAGGIYRNADVAFGVLSLPQSPLRSPTVAKIRPTKTPAIPSIDVWQQKMATLGEKWCQSTQQMAFGVESQIWYYDGGRTYFQLADYTNTPDRWVPCAVNILTQYRDNILQRGGKLQGWRIFPQGLAMNYWRTGDTGSRDAVIALAHNSPYAASAGGLTTTLIRETAYIIETWTVAERLGEAHDPRLDRAVDFGLGHFNQLISSNQTLVDQPFYDGLMAEALIQYYELSQDPRIPGAIQQMLDYEWTNAWDSKSQQMLYNTLEVPRNHYATGLNNLLAPAFAWYWALTGDRVYRVRGDQMFSASINEDISYSAKIYNQNYRWSFDYVRWRQRGTPAPSAFLTDSMRR
jgi:hypothetical protein